MMILAESWPAGMNAGSGETDTRPGVPNAKVMKLPPAGAGSVNCTCAGRSSFTFIEYPPASSCTVACTASTAVSPA